MAFTLSESTTLPGLIKLIVPSGLHLGKRRAQSLRRHGSAKMSREKRTGCGPLSTALGDWCRQVMSDGCFLMSFDEHNRYYKTT
jgi:hypothetical protein